MLKRWLLSRELRYGVSELRRATGLPKRVCVRVLSRAESQEYPRIVFALIEQCDTGGFFYDPIEDDPAYAAMCAAATSAAEAEMGGSAYAMGSCFRFWNIKKRILKKKFGISWLSPEEMNPSVVFD